MNEHIIKQLKEWVNKNYNQHTTGWTSQRSMGNFDDCFEDGAECGRSWCAYEVGQILGIELEEPDTQEFEY